MEGTDGGRGRCASQGGACEQTDWREAGRVRCPASSPEKERSSPSSAPPPPPPPAAPPPPRVSEISGRRRRRSHPRLIARPARIRGVDLPQGPMDRRGGRRRQEAAALSRRSKGRRWAPARLLRGGLVSALLLIPRILTGLTRVPPMRRCPLAAKQGLLGVVSNRTCLLWDAARRSQPALPSDPLAATLVGLLRRHPCHRLKHQQINDCTKRSVKAREQHARRCL